MTSAVIIDRSKLFLELTRENDEERKLQQRANIDAFMKRLTATRDDAPDGDLRPSDTEAEAG